MFDEEDIVLCIYGIDRVGTETALPDTRKERNHYKRLSIEMMSICKFIKILSSYVISKSTSFLGLQLQWNPLHKKNG